MTTISEQLTYEPAELGFGTSGLRGLVTDMTDLECYINALGFLRFLVEYDGLVAGKTVYLAGDLRTSTPRILLAMVQAITDAGMQPVNCGLIPTPAVAYYALQHDAPCIMVTGSHIPADRNGIKFYKCAGEILKSDEAPIKQAVADVRAKLYERDAEGSTFDPAGMLTVKPMLPPLDERAAQTYVERYVSVFGSDALKDTALVYYQHSAVGRDILVGLLEQLGATVAPVGRSEVFVPIDSENVTPEDQAYFKQLTSEHTGTFAIVSTDGDSDRPFVIDETGFFHRGDVLGAVTATWLQSDSAAYPVSSSDATDTYLSQHDIPTTHTKIGSPYVIAAMQEAQVSGSQRTVGWEVNGGFLIGNDFEVRGNLLKALPTRDAILPIIIALLAAKDASKKVSELFAQLPARYTQAGLIDDFPLSTSASMVARYGQDSSDVRNELAKYFSPEKGFPEVIGINTLDGVRITFSNGDIAHVRPSGNAPQLRIYSVANTQERADQIVEMAITEPNGIFRAIEAGITAA